MPPKWKKPRKLPKFYAVLNGRDGPKCIYTNWDQCYAATTKVKKCLFTSFESKDQAEKFLGDPPYQYIEEQPKKEELKVELESNIVYCDGGCDGNGTANAMGGIGVFYGMNDPRNICIRISQPIPTNNRCELMAAILAVSGFERESSGIIRTDSMYTINWYNSSEKPQKTDPNYILISQLLWQRELHPDVKLEYVKAHCGILGNEGADELTKLARK